MAEMGEKTPRRALGRGLDALLPSAPAANQPAPQASPHEQTPKAAVLLDIASIDANPFQTRQKTTPAALEELRQSIALHGVLQPILVRPTSDGRYQLVAGQRRWLASQAAGKMTIPAVVKAVSDSQALELTIIENLQREDLDPIEQARAFARLHDEFQMHHEEIAQRTGKDRSSITNYLRLLRLPMTVQAMVADGQLSAGHAKSILALDQEMQENVAARVVAQELSVRKTEELVNSIIRPGGKDEKQKKPVDPNVRDAEKKLRDLLQMKVSVEDRKGRGKIVIEYASLAEFDRLLAHMEQAAGRGSL